MTLVSSPDPSRRASLARSSASLAHSSASLTHSSASLESGVEHNIASHLPRVAERSPERIAVIAPEGSRAKLGLARRTAWSSCSFADLDRYCDAIAHGLATRGLAPGDRVALFVRPGLDLVAISFALFKLGAVPVIVDPGMGAGALVSCVARMKPRAFIGVPAAQVLRALHKRELSSIEISVTVGPRWFAGTTTLSELARGSQGAFPTHAVRPDDEAAVLFTSGSTGPAKGVVYSHANFAAQVRVLRELYGLAPGEIDLACFPLFALFSAALEMTAVFPLMDASRPGRCDPERIVEAILEHGATNTFGSPAIWRRVVPWCEERGIRLPTLRRAMIAGASVPLDLVDGFRRILDGDADVHTPYGATECLPVSSIGGRELLGDLRARSESGAGTCIGRPAPGIEIALIAIHDDPILEWGDARTVEPGELGEICVRGDVVTREYKFDERATALSKIRDDRGPANGGAERLWHRMGDLGYVDGDGLLWFCGRKSHRIESAEGITPAVPSENVYNLHPRVRQSALVGVGPRGRERPVLIVEPEAKAMPKNAAECAAFARELQELAHERRELARERGELARERGDLAHERAELARSRAEPSPTHTEPSRKHGESAHEHGRAPCNLALPRVESVLYRRSFPMDVRHNAKIQREKLKAWAEAETK